LLGIPTLRLHPFGNDVSASIGGPDIGALPSQAIEAFRDPALRLQVEHTTIAGLIFDASKTDATLIQEPLLLLERMIAKLKPTQTPEGVHIAGMVSAGDVLDAVGGLSGFPSYALLHRVATARLRDKSFRASQSDVYDLMHAAYSIYASFTALDRSYSSRVRRARPDLQSRVSHQLSEVSAWLAA
jgi:hypothetical protein